MDSASQEQNPVAPSADGKPCTDGSSNDGGSNDGSDNSDNDSDHGNCDCSDCNGSDDSDNDQLDIILTASHRRNEDGKLGPVSQIRFTCEVTDFVGIVSDPYRIPRVQWLWLAGTTPGTCEFDNTCGSKLSITRDESRTTLKRCYTVQSTIIIQNNKQLTKVTFEQTNLNIPNEDCAQAFQTALQTLDQAARTPEW